MRLYGDPDPVFTYQASGFRLTDTAATTLAGSPARAAGENVGVYRIGQGDVRLLSANYALTFIDGALLIAPAPLAVAADSFSRLYGDPDPAFTYQASGFRLGDTAEGTVSGGLVRASGEDVGAYAIDRGSLAFGSNYFLSSFAPGVLSIAPAPLTVRADNLSRLYGDADPALTYQASGLRRTDTVSSTLAGALSRAPGEDVGTYAVGQGSLGLVSGNYTLAFIPGALAVTPAPLTVAADSFTRLYGDPDPAFTYQASGFRLGDTVAGVLTGIPARAPGETVGSYPVGRGTVALLSANYSLNFVDGALAITPAPLSVAADSFSRLYGDPDPAFTYQASGFRLGDTVAGTVSGSLSRAPGETVGDYAINLGGLSAGPNYIVSTFTPGVLAITPAPLTVTADSFSRLYGQPDPAFTYQTSGLRRGDTPASTFTGSLSRAPGEAVGVYPIGQGGLALATANYTLAFIGGRLTIAAAPLVVRADPSGKQVGESDPPLTYSVDGLQFGESADGVLSGNVQRAPGEDVGVYPIGQGDLSLVSANYTLTFEDAPFFITGEPFPPFIRTAFDPFYPLRRVRGRDPDTPGDAAWRTTEFENPYLPDIFIRAYGLGGIEAGGTTAPAMLAAGVWLEQPSDRTGQHVDRATPPPPCPAGADSAATSLCGAYAPLADYWLARP